MSASAGARRSSSENDGSGDEVTSTRARRRAGAATIADAAAESDARVTVDLCESEGDADEDDEVGDEEDESASEAEAVDHAHESESKARPTRSSSSSARAAATTSPAASLGEDSDEALDAAPSTPPARRSRASEHQQQQQEHKSASRHERERTSSRSSSAAAMDVEEDDDRRAKRLQLTPTRRQQPPRGAAAAADAVKENPGAAAAASSSSAAHEDALAFADLSTPSLRYTALLHNLPGKESLVRLVRLVARPEGEEFELERDPLCVAPLFSGSSASSGKNLVEVQKFLRNFTRHPSCSPFSERLTAAKLLSYETSLRSYLQRTGGIPPIDFGSIQSKLAATKPDSRPVRDAEGFESCYPNSVAAVLVDIVNVLLNACKFNPPKHFIHGCALELAERLPKALAALRKSVDVESDALVCLTCGSGESEEGSRLGMLMLCENCSLWHHQLCAGVSVVPKDSFICSACQRENPKLAIKGAKQAAAQPEKTATPRPRAVSPAPRTHSRGASAAPADSDALSHKRKEAPGSGGDAASKKQRASDATNRSTKPVGMQRSPSPVGMLPEVSAAAAAAALPRAPSPDARWVRLQTFAARSRIGRASVRQELFTPSNLASTSGAAGPRGDDEGELRALRVQLDAAMRVMAASSERLVELTDKQRTRARRAAAAQAEQTQQARALDGVIEALLEPIESDVAMKPAAPSPAGASAAASASSSATPAAASSEDLSSRLAKYRHRFASQSRLLRQQAQELSAARASAATLAQQYDDVRAEARMIQAQQHVRIIELEAALSESKAFLTAERRARNDAVQQAQRLQEQVHGMVQRLDLTVVGSPICAQFGTKLLREVQQRISSAASGGTAAGGVSGAAATSKQSGQQSSTASPAPQGSPSAFNQAFSPTLQAAMSHFLSSQAMTTVPQAGAQTQVPVARREQQQTQQVKQPVAPGVGSAAASAATPPSQPRASPVASVPAAPQQPSPRVSQPAASPAVSPPPVASPALAPVSTKAPSSRASEWSPVIATQANMSSPFTAPAAGASSAVSAALPPVASPAPSASPVPIAAASVVPASTSAAASSVFTARAELLRSLHVSLETWVRTGSANACSDALRVHAQLESTGERFDLEEMEQALRRSINTQAQQQVQQAQQAQQQQAQQQMAWQQMAWQQQAQQMFAFPPAAQSGGFSNFGAGASSSSWPDTLTQVQLLGQQIIQQQELHQAQAQQLHQQQTRILAQSPGAAVRSLPPPVPASAPFGPPPSHLQHTPPQASRPVLPAPHRVMQAAAPAATSTSSGQAGAPSPRMSASPATSTPPPPAPRASPSVMPARMPSPSASSRTVVPPASSASPAPASASVTAAVLPPSAAGGTSERGRSALPPASPPVLPRLEPTHGGGGGIAEASAPARTESAAVEAEADDDVPPLIPNTPRR